MRRLFDALRPLGAPTIHFGTGNASLLEAFAAAGSDLVKSRQRIT
jgi:uroporphyrinogen decarboxylase